MPLQRHLILCGFMGAGKTTVGKHLAHLLQAPFTDLDEEIEREAGCTITEFFATKGEAAFRHIEQRLLHHVLEMPPRVIAVGGGAVQEERSMAEVLRHGTVIYLEAPVSALYERILTELPKRPLLYEQHKDDLRPFIASLLEKRANTYRMANHTIDATLPPEIVAGSILALPGIGG